MEKKQDDHRCFMLSLHGDDLGCDVYLSTKKQWPFSCFWAEWQWKMTVNTAVPGSRCSDNTVLLEKVVSEDFFVDRNAIKVNWFPHIRHI